MPVPGEAQETQPRVAVAVPGYAVGARIGAGGFGEVFQARHEVIGRDVAIKVLHAKYSQDASAVARFVAEARAVNRISHPGIVQIHDFGVLADGRHFCVMELLRGTTLRDVLAERERLPVEEALPLLRGIADAVDAAHAAGIAHRDLKPDNVFVLEDGGVKLIDFGMAKLVEDEAAAVTVTGAVFGTPLYMSPEQCRGRAIDPRTDAYSFGVLAYHVLTGAPPWRGDALELALHHLNDEPEPPSRRCAALGPRIDRVVLALLAKDPAERPMPLVAAIEAMSGNAALPPRRRRRGRWLAGGLALVATGAVVAVAASASRGRPASSSRTTAPPTWTIREVADIPTSFAATLMSDGVAVLFSDSSGLLRVGLDTPSSTPVSVTAPEEIRGVSALPDGRLLISRDQPDGFWIWIEDLRSGARTRLTTGRHGQAGPPGKFAFERAGTIYTRDLTDQREELITTVAGRIEALTWAPEGRHLAWMRTSGSEQAVEIRDAVDGSVRRIPAKATTVYGSMPMAFVGPASLIYCDLQRRVQHLDLETGAEQTLRQLAPNTNACSMRATLDGRRVTISNGRYELHAAVLPTADPTRGWTRVAPGAVEDWTPDGRVVVGAWGPPEPRWQRHQVARELPAIALHTLDGAAGVPFERCEGSEGLRRRGDELLFNVNVVRDGEMVMQMLRPGSCDVVDAWTLPDVPGWFYPRCGTALCATVREEGELVSVVALRRGQPSGHALARFAVVRPAVGGFPRVSVSPDDRWIAVGLYGIDDLLWVIDATTGERRTLHVGPWPGTEDTGGRTWTTTWSASSDAIYVSSSHPEAATVTRVPLDGSAPQLVWDGPQGYVGLHAHMSPDGAWLGGNVLAVTVELLVLDRQ